MAIALGLLLGLQPLTTDLYLPAMPLIQRDLQAPMDQLQLTMAGLILGFGLAQLVWGPVSDRWGRRPVLLLSLACYTAAGAGCALAHTIDQLVLLRVAQGASLAAAIVLARAMVRDLYEPVEGAQVMSRGMSGLGLIALVSMPLGGWLATHGGWQACLWAVTAMGGLTATYVAWRLPETLPPQRRQALAWGPWKEAVRSILTHPGFRAWAALVTSTYAGLFVLLSTSALVFIGTLGWSPQAYGVALGSNSAAYLAGTVACRRWILRCGVAGAVRRGGIATALGSVGLLIVAALASPHSDTLPALPGGVPLWGVLLLAQWCYAFGHGVHQPCGQTGAVGPFPHRAGLASALAGCLMAVVAFLIGLAMGAAFDGSLRFMAIGIALPGLLTAWVAWTWVQRHA